MKLPPLSRSHVAVLVAVLVVLATAAVLVLSGVLTVSVGVLGGTGDPPPQGSFHVQDDDANATIVRDVGGPVNASKLEIRVNDDPRGTWKELSNGDTTVERGDRLMVPNVESGDEVSMYWLGGDSPKLLVQRHV